MPLLTIEPIAYSVMLDSPPALLPSVELALQIWRWVSHLSVKRETHDRSMVH